MNAVDGNSMSLLIMQLTSTLKHQCNSVWLEPLYGHVQDPGGLNAGELPDAPPIWVESERDLKHEIEKLVVALDEKQDWTKRIEVT